MKQPRAYIKILAIASGLALVVGACGSATSPSPSATAAGSTGPAPSGSAAAVNQCGDASVNLSIWGGYPEDDPAFKLAGEAFKKDHPNVDLTVFSTDLRGFEQKLTTALPSKTAGDVIFATTSLLARFIDQGIIAPVPDDLIAFVKGGSYAPASVQLSTYKDKIWDVPMTAGQKAIYYNKDMLAEAGITDPPTSMDQLFADAKKLVKLDSAGNVVRSGLSLRISGSGSGVAEKFWVWLLQYGRTLIKETSPGKFQADFNGPEGVKLVQTYVDLLKEKVDSPNVDHDTKAFETKATAMFLREENVIADIAKNAPDLVGHYGTVSLPVGGLGLSGGLFVPAASPNAQCAWEFIRSLIQPAQQLSLMKISGWTPARTDLDLTEFLKANPTYEGFLKHPDGFKQTLLPPLPEFDEIETKLATHLVDAFAQYENLSGQPDKIQTLLNTWADETNQILKGNGHYGG